MTGFVEIKDKKLFKVIVNKLQILRGKWCASRLPYLLIVSVSEETDEWSKEEK